MASPDDVWIVDFGDPFPQEPAHERPAVIVGPSVAWAEALPYVFVVPLTTAHRDMPYLHVEIEPDDGNGLHEVSYAQCELLRSVSKRRLRHRLGDVEPSTSALIEEAVRDLLGY